MSFGPTASRCGPTTDWYLLFLLFLFLFCPDFPSFVGFNFTDANTHLNIKLSNNLKEKKYVLSLRVTHSWSLIPTAEKHPSFNLYIGWKSIILFGPILPRHVELLPPHIIMIIIIIRFIKNYSTYFSYVIIYLAFTGYVTTSDWVPIGPMCSILGRRLARPVFVHYPFKNRYI